jgi:hypothetical protein
MKAAVLTQPLFSFNYHLTYIFWYNFFMDSKKTNLQSSLTRLEETLNLYLVQKAPAIPKDIKELIVSFLPWLTVIGLLLMIPGILAIIGLSTISLPVSYMVGARYGIMYFVSIIFMVITAILLLMAAPGLFKRQKKSWYFLYYVSIITAISDIVSLNIFGFILTILLGFYILFQIKEYYK